MLLSSEMIGGLTSYILSPTAGNKPDAIVIFLHGYGADGRDLIDIGREWAGALPSAVFVSPDAPHACGMNPAGREWFSLDEYTLPAMEAKIVDAWPALNGFIDAARARWSVPSSRIILCGFSQGCMMALYALPRYREPLGGIIGYSGRLLGTDGLKNGANRETPICLFHGEDDPIVPVQSHPHAVSALRENGYTVEGRTVPGLAHGIDRTGLVGGRAFLTGILQPDQ